MSINTPLEVKDLRVVQLILQDSSYIEVKGIAIYYDFIRKMGNVKNKEFIAHKPSKDETIDQNNISSQIIKYKKLLDGGLIDEEEFKALKKKILES